MITRERLMEVLHYAPETGVFTWRITMGSRAQAGGVAGSYGNAGKWDIRIDKRLYRGHRLAWLYMTGEWPSKDIDHEDGDASNNAFSNLREATNEQNLRNRGAQANNTSGYKGVSWSREKKLWAVMIRYGGKYRLIGRFPRIENAKLAYNLMAVMHHGKFARL